jgi:pilus assembly protein Flp/PilA
MQSLLLKFYLKVRVFRGNDGQDLIEYALVAALIALAATAGMNTIANDINSAFTTIGGTITTYT